MATGSQSQSRKPATQAPWPVLLAALGMWMLVTLLTLHKEQCRHALFYDVLLTRPSTSSEPLNLMRRSLHSQSQQKRAPARAQDASAGESIKGTVTEESNFTCDFSHFRTDVCHLRGDVRVSGRSGTVTIASSSASQSPPRDVARIRPYTRKWETSCMKTIGEVSMRVLPAENSSQCDVRHSVPAIIFSTGGYTGNVYHEFNDGLIPLFITASRFRGEVVFMILELHKWWMTKYNSVVSQLSSHPVINFDQSDRVHCFPQVIVGLSIHDELSIDPEKVHDPHETSMLEFQRLLKRSFNPNASSSGQVVEALVNPVKRPKIVLLTRKGSRVLLNQNQVQRLAKELGFRVETLQLNSHTELWKVYQQLQSAEVLVGVHGAALTHELFLRPGSVLIQIVPLGTDWAAKTYYGEPAVKMGLRYLEYKILPEESSLLQSFGRNHSVVKHPERITEKGWWEMKKVYLEQQDVKVKLARFRRVLVRALTYTRSRELHATSL